MRQVFTQTGAGRLSDWLRGVWLDPRWLRNRGMWSILIKRLLLRRHADRRLACA